MINTSLQQGDTTVATIHPFEVAGLGFAPFKFVGVEERVIAYPGGHTQASGTCSFCGKGIRYCFHIRSSDNKSFIVGCDCVKKIDRQDNRLATDVERAMAKINREKLEKKKEEKWKKEMVQREAVLQQQRDKNGGLTDREVEQKKAEEERRIKFEKYSNENAKLIEALDWRGGRTSQFCQDMIAHLQYKPFDDLSGNAQCIVEEIVAKYEKAFRKKAK